MKLTSTMSILGTAGLLTAASLAPTHANAGVILTNVDPNIIAGSISTSGNTQASIEFVNHLNYAVDVYWMNYSGQRVFYNTLGAGASYLQGTYITHPWLIVANGSNALVTGFASALTPDPGWTGLSPDIANIGSAAPELSTWAMLIIGFAGLGFASYRATGKSAALPA